MTAKPLFILSLIAILLLPSCSEEQKEASEEKWENLLGGEDIYTVWQPAARRDGKRTKEIGTRWSLKDGVLTLVRKEAAEGRGGSIETKSAYRNFELKFEFKVDYDSNSGIKYRYLNATGFEYQITDDHNYRDNKPSHRTGELYELQIEQSPRIVKKHGEWNTGKIIANGNILEHWLNGQKVFRAEINSEEWKKTYEKSKYFKQGIKDFGNHTSAIYIQDHSDTGISFRNMLVRAL